MASMNWNRTANILARERNRESRLAYKELEPFKAPPGFYSQLKNPWWLRKKQRIAKQRANYLARIQLQGLIRELFHRAQEENNHGR